MQKRATDIDWKACGVASRASRNEFSSFPRIIGQNCQRYVPSGLPAVARTKKSRGTGKDDDFTVLRRIIKSAGISWKKAPRDSLKKLKVNNIVRMGEEPKI